MSEQTPKNTLYSTEENNEENNEEVDVNIPATCKGLSTVLVELLSQEDCENRQEELSSSEDSEDSEDSEYSEYNEDSVDSNYCGALKDPRWLAFNKLLSTHDKLTEAFLVMVLDE